MQIQYEFIRIGSDLSKSDLIPTLVSLGAAEKLIESPHL